MVDMDSWCPSCGYSVEPGTRFCGGCGEPLAAPPGVSADEPSTLPLQAAQPAPGPGYPPSGPEGGSTTPLPAPVTGQAPPPSGTPASWPPPPPPSFGSAAAYAGAPGPAGQA